MLSAEFFYLKYSFCRSLDSDARGAQTTPRTPTPTKLCLCITVHAFEKLHKGVITFVMSVGPHETARLPLDGFS